MITLRDLAVFASGAVLASMQVSACGDDDRPPLAEEVIGSDGGQIPEERIMETSDAFHARTCWSPIRGHTEQCGVVMVPESPGSEELVELAVVRVFAKSENPKPDPIIYLEGGPGGAVVGDLDLVFPAFSALAEDRDLIFFDQRGTGKSKPSLKCEGEEDLGECYQALLQVTEPAAFNSAESARDVEAIRQALAYDEINLFGISYGTRLALTVLRDFPQAVRAAVIDGVVPLHADLLGQLTPNGNSAFDLVFEECSLQMDCREKYPELRKQMIEVAVALDEEPFQGDGFEVDGATFISILFNLLYSPVALEFVPLIIDQAAGGGFELFEDLAINLAGGDFSFGMHLSVQCAEELPFTSREAMTAAAQGIEPEIFRAIGGLDYFDYCEQWPVPTALSRENEAVTSSIPTLGMSGRFDPITPPEYADLALETLSHSFAFVFRGESHGASVSECGLSVVQSFLDAPEKAPQAPCLADQPDPEFQALRGRPAGGESSGRRRIVGSPPRFATETPSEEKIAEARKDLERRLHL